jgi:excisionase family DNA binding protein
MSPELLSIPAAMERLGNVSRGTVYNLIAEGRLQRVNLGRRAFITGASLDALLKELVAA